MTPVHNTHSPRFTARGLVNPLPRNPRRQAELVLRDVAYVLRLTEQVKARMVSHQR